MAEQAAQTPKKRQFLFNPLKRPLPYVGLILALLIVIFQGTIRQYTSNLVGDWLVSSLRENTGGNYTLEYEYVRFDIFTKELRIKNLTLKLDTSVIDQDTYLEQYSNLVDISTPVVVLKLRSFWDLIVNDKLLIAFIGFQEPDIKLIRSEILTEEEKLENQEETTEKLRDYLKELAVDSFRVQNGALHVGYRNLRRQDVVDFKIRNFSTVLRGFKLDEKNPQRLFHGLYVEDLQLEILDQELILPQLKHRLSFTRLYISTIDSLVQLDTLKLSPLATADSTFKGKISLNELALEGINFRKAYDEYKIDIRRLLIDQPDIDIIKKGLSGNKEKIDIAGTHVLFEEILLREITLKDARLNLDLQRKYSSGLLNMTIHNYHIDTAKVDLGDLTKNITDFYITASNSTIEMPDSIHQIDIGRLVVNSTDSILLANNIKYNPIPARRQYKLYKERGVRLINYATVKQVFVQGIAYNQAINNQQLMADSILILSPTSNITEYPYIRKKPVAATAKPLSFFIKAITVANGNINYNKRQNRQNNRSQLSGLSATLHALYPDEEEGIGFDSLQLVVLNGFSEVKAMGHTVRFSGLETKNLTDLDIANLSFSPDSSTLQGQKINFSASGLQLRGFDRAAIGTSGMLKLAKVSAATLTLNADLRQQQTGRQPAGRKPVLKQVLIDKIQFGRGDVRVIDRDNDLKISNITTLIDSLHLNLQTAKTKMPVNFRDLTVTHGDFSFQSVKKNIHLTGKLGSFSETDSLINFENITFKTGNNLQVSCHEIALKGFNRQAMLTNRGLEFNYLFINSPKFVIRPAKKDSLAQKASVNPDSLKYRLLTAFSFIKFDSVISTNGNLALVGNNRTTRINNFNAVIAGYHIDSTSRIADVIEPERANIEVDEIRTMGRQDTVIVRDVSLDMTGNKLFTGTIDATLHFSKNQLTASIPGIYANGFSSTNFINSNFSFDTIRFARGVFNLHSFDSLKNLNELDWDNRTLDEMIEGIFNKPEKLLFDSLLLRVRNKELNPVVVHKDSARNFNFNKLLGKMKLKMDGREKEAAADSSSQVVVADTIPQPAPERPETVTEYGSTTISKGLINYISFNNSTFNWYQNGNHHKVMSKLNFSIGIENLLLDSLHSFNIYQHFGDMTVRINDYKLDFKDSLNRLAFDELKLSTKNERITIRNLSLIPMVNKYEYAKRVGRQVSWQKLEGLDIKIDELNIFKIISTKAVHAAKITTNNGVLDVFKDKELPIPVNQRKPMLQDAIKSVKVPISIDCLEVNNFRINFSSRLSSAYPEGKLEFHDMHAVATNIVNSDSLIALNRYLLLSASTRIMGKGQLNANFNFDLADPTNAFIFDAHLGPMQAKEFNSILSALAFVNIESGDIKDLSLEAEGDNYYATGNMRFIYNNLKVSTINKKNLKTKGMGKVIKTFFANAFVVKKNNPSFKVFPRDGAMYYERNPQKIIIDYVTKTALSGVVSSIGARNARKDIKRIQKESKKQKDEEKKALRKANRNKTTVSE